MFLTSETHMSKHRGGEREREREREREFLFLTKSYATKTHFSQWEFYLTIILYNKCDKNMGYTHISEIFN